jgi:hypothetical protein
MGKQIVFLPLEDISMTISSQVRLVTFVFFYHSNPVKESTKSGSIRDVLLKKWDGKRNIERDQVYKKLSLKRKEDLLSRLAFDTFDRGEYFFKKSTAENYIADYIQNIPGASDDDLQLDSEAVLKSIMAQHGLLVERASGIFSFSHLTFHEYFAAKRIVDSSIAQGIEAFQKLASHVDDKRWKEVFFLVLGMLPDASSCVLTIKQEIDQILADDPKMQEYLVWLNEKVRSINWEDFPRGYLFHLYFCPNDCLNYSGHNASLDFELYVNIDLCHCMETKLDRAIKEAQELDCNNDFITQLKSLNSRRLPYYPGPDIEEYERQEKCMNEWQSELRELTIQHRNIGHDWKFTQKQKMQVYIYHTANTLLIEFIELESECYIDQTTRRYINNTFCRPFHLIPPV